MPKKMPSKLVRSKTKGRALRHVKFYAVYKLDDPNLKGTDRLCKVVKVSMQCCGKIL